MPRCTRPPAAQRGVEVEADPQRRRHRDGAAVTRSSDSTRVDHQRHPLGGHRVGGQAAQRVALGGRVADDDVLDLLGQPQRLGQGEGEDAGEARGSRTRSRQRPAAHRLAGHPDRRPGARGAPGRRRWRRTPRRSTTATGASRCCVARSRRACWLTMRGTKHYRGYGADRRRLAQLGGQPARRRRRGRDAPRPPTRSPQVVADAAADGRRVRPIGSGHSFTGDRGAGRRAAAARPAGPASSHVDDATGLVTVEAGIPLHRLNRALFDARAGADQPRRHRRADGGRGDLDRHPRQRRCASAASPPRCVGLELVLPDGSTLVTSETENADVLSLARGRPRRAGGARDRDAAGRAGVRAPRPRGPRRARRRARSGSRTTSRAPTTSTSTGSRTPARCSPSTTAPPARRRPRSRSAPAAPGGTTSSSPTPSSPAWSASAAGCRGWCRRSPGSWAGCSATREFRDVSYRVFASPPARCGSRRWSTPCRARHGLDVRPRARRPGRPQRLADRRPRGDPHRGRRRRRAVDRLRPRLGLRGRAHRAPAARTARPTSPRWSRSPARSAAGRTGASCTASTPASLRERYPRFEEFRALRDRLDPDRVLTNPYLDRVLG